MARVSIFLVVFLGAAISAHSLPAQIPYQRYTSPAGPALPYYLDYFRPQSGELDVYNQFVAPKSRLSNQLQTMAQQERFDFHEAEKQIKQGGQIRPSEAAPTGTSARFMNYSHYFGSTTSPSSRTFPRIGRVR
jgi:hypothetical protein